MFNCHSQVLPPRHPPKQTYRLELRWDQSLSFWNPSSDSLAFLSWWASGHCPVAKGWNDLFTVKDCSPATMVSTSLSSGSVLEWPTPKLSHNQHLGAIFSQCPGGVPDDHAPLVPWLCHLVKCIIERYPISQALGWGHLSESNDQPIELTLSFAAGPLLRDR